MTEQEIRKEIKQTNKRHHKKRKIKPIAVIVLILLVVLGGTYTWYYFQEENKGDRKDVQIMTPYFLYLLNPDAQSSLQFAVGNIHPGETKQIVICVSNKKPDDVQDGSIDIARDSKFNYDLQFIYTENLPVNYNIYELKTHEYTNPSEIPQDGLVVEGANGIYFTKNDGKLDDEGNPKPLTITKDVTNERLKNVFGESDLTDVVNTGKYKLYQYDGNAESAPLGLEYRNNEYEFDYYLIEMNLRDGISFNDYTKETDLLYVVVNAKQPKPTH